jgi:tight adherence protein B
MSLWAVCALSFVAILTVALVAMLSPLARKERESKQARLDEVQRYRVLAAYDDAQVAAIPSGPAESALTQKALSVVDKAVRARGQRSRLLDELERAGLRIRPEEWAALQLLVPVALLAIGGFALGPVGLLVGGALGWAGCRGFIRMRISRRRAAFESQLPDSLQLLAGALRTGFALNQAMATVVREGVDPVSSEFGRALQEVRLGANLEDALDDLADRMHSYDMKLVVMAIRTAREVGGNLAEVLLTTVATMRERVQLRGMVRTLSAEARISAKVLIALPLLMSAYLLAFKRTYLQPLYTTGTGIALLVGGGTLLLLGTVWLQKLTKIEV